MPPQGPTGHRGLVGRALGALLVDHLLILLGAYLLVESTLSSSASELRAGVALVVAGVAVEVAVLGWTASLARRAALVLQRPRTEDRDSTTLSLPRSACLSCGWAGAAPRGAVCPRCYRPTVRRP